MEHVEPDGIIFFLIPGSVLLTFIFIKGLKALECHLLCLLLKWLGEIPEIVLEQEIIYLLHYWLHIF